MSVGLKICGVRTEADARLCRDSRVTAVGLNFWEGSTRCVTPTQGRALVAALHPGPLAIGVFVDQPPQTVARIATDAGLDAIQPHGDADPQAYAALGIPWVWVIRTPVDPTSLIVPVPAPCWVVVDAPTPHFGGQGIEADWEWAAQVVRALAPLPVWLAGGLRPSNAAEAILKVGPAGLDVASGAEVVGVDPPRKDAVAIAALASICVTGDGPK